MPITIGLVDDHQLFLKSLSLMLETLQGFEVMIEALNGKDLQQKIALVKSPPDIILLDVNMPMMDGVATTKWLQEHYPAIKLMALTMNNNDHSVIEMFRAGCCAYLLKDTHPLELKKALHQVYEQGYYNADAVQFNAARLLHKSQQESEMRLTLRESVFLQWACSDLTYKQIASEMGVSERTVDGYRESLFQKFGVQSRVGLCLEAVRNDLVKL